MMQDISYSIFDGHNDTLKKLYLSGKNFLVENENVNIDLPSAKKGGFAAGNFAIQVPPEHLEERAFGYGLTIYENGWKVEYAKPISQCFAQHFTNDVLELLFTLAKQTDEIKVIHTTEQLDECLKRNVLGVIIHFEGAEVIKENLENLSEYYNKGLRSLGLVWSRPNCFGYGVPFIFPASPDTGPGLTAAGKKLVQACNELGILIDLTHMNQKGFFDVAALSKAPLVVSHANVHALSPSTCNLTDAQIDAVGASGGIIGVNFDVLNIRTDGQLIFDTPLEFIVKHIDYIAQRIGIDFVGLGSDFDGAQLPINLKNVAMLPNLINALKNAGYHHEDLYKITHKNWIRVIKQTWK